MLNNWLKIGLTLLIVVAVSVAAYFRLPKSTSPIISFLPKNTVFYYHWEKSALAPDFVPEQFYLFDFEESQMRLDTVRQILGDDFLKVDNIIWFKNSNLEDYFLIVLPDHKNLVKNLQNNNPQLGFKYLDKNILLIGPSQGQAEALVAGGFDDAGSDQGHFGLSMYWQTQDAPDFLQSLSQFVSPFFPSGKVFANIGKTDGIYRLKMFEVWPNSQNEVQNVFADARLPMSDGLIAGFNKTNALSNSEFIKQNILDPFFSSLPVTSLVFQVKEDWLLVSQEDFGGLARDLSQNLEVEEIIKTLPDGTSYIELISKVDQSIKNHDFRGKKYWQIGNLFGLEQDGNYYLSNNQDLIEQIMGQFRLLSDLWINCPIEIGDNTQDFIKIKVDLLPESNLKGYLNSQNIKNLSIFSYQNSQKQGFQLCFE